MIRLKEKLAHYSWDIAYGVYSESIITNGLNDVKINFVKNPYKNKWFADPFILEENNFYIQFLVEEYDYDVRKGRIARIKVNKKSNCIEELSIVLELSTHLSFPVIYRIDNEIFVHPENSASGASFVYRYDRIKDKLIEPKIVLDEPIADAIIRKEHDGFHMFATRVPDTNGCTLHEYFSKSQFGPYKHIGEEIFEHNTARMAGMFLIDSCGRVIRPAQDCFGSYGKAVILYDGHRPLCRIEPTTYRYDGIHTLNTLDKAFVIDYKKYDYPLLYWLLNKLKR